MHFPPHNLWSSCCHVHRLELASSIRTDLGGRGCARVCSCVIPELVEAGHRSVAKSGRPRSRYHHLQGSYATCTVVLRVQHLEVWQDTKYRALHTSSSLLLQYYNNSSTSAVSYYCRVLRLWARGVVVVHGIVVSAVSTACVAPLYVR